eukprot:4329237-Ditylum_brightwellii.AAC.1
MNVWYPPEACPPLTPTVIISGKRPRQRGGKTMNDKGERLDDNGEEEAGCAKGIITGFFIQQDPKKASDKVLMWVYGGFFWMVMPKGIHQL